MKNPMVSAMFGASMDAELREVKLIFESGLASEDDVAELAHDYLVFRRQVDRWVQRFSSPPTARELRRELDL